MRNLKKILALVLALVMSFSLMATANAFEDDKDIDATFDEAVTVLSNLKVFQGYDNGKTFQPKGDITRAEVAAIIYRIVTGDVADKQVGIYADYNKFNDVKSGSWYAGYVNYCANAEYIKGRDAKTFDPNGKVTGYEALAMILRAVGYDKNGEFTGSSWQVQTAAVAKKLGITDKINAGLLGGAATREAVAEILFRSILVPQVEYTVAFGYQNKSFGLFGKENSSIGYQTFRLEQTEGEVTAIDYHDGETVFTAVDDKNVLGAYTRVINTDADWTKIGYAAYAYTVPTANAKTRTAVSDVTVTGSSLGDSTNGTAYAGLTNENHPAYINKTDANVRFYYNGMLCTTPTAEDNAKAAVGKVGVKVDFVDNDFGGLAEVVVVTDYTVAYVTAITNTSNTGVQGVQSDSYYLNNVAVKANNLVCADELAYQDLVTYVAYDGVYYVVKAAYTQDAFSRINYQAVGGASVSYVIGNETYIVSAKAVKNELTSALLTETFDVFTDPYGHIIYAAKAADVIDYLYVIANDHTVGTTGLANAKVVNTDGTIVNVNVAKATGHSAIIDVNELAGHMYGYTVNANGSYNLTKCSDLTAVSYDKKTATMYGAEGNRGVNQTSVVIDLRGVSVNSDAATAVYTGYNEIPTFTGGALHYVAVNNWIKFAFLTSGTADLTNNFIVYKTSTNYEEVVGGQHFYYLDVIVNGEKQENYKLTAAEYGYIDTYGVGEYSITKTGILKEYTSFAEELVTAKWSDFGIELSDGKFYTYGEIPFTVLNITSGTAQPYTMVHGQDVNVYVHKSSTAVTEIYIIVGEMAYAYTAGINTPAPTFPKDNATYTYYVKDNLVTGFTMDVNKTNAPTVVLEGSKDVPAWTGDNAGNYTVTVPYETWKTWLGKEFVISPATGNQIALNNYVSFGTANLKVGVMATEVGKDKDQTQTFTVYSQSLTPATSFTGTKAYNYTIVYKAAGTDAKLFANDVEVTDKISTYKGAATNFANLQKWYTYEGASCDWTFYDGNGIKVDVTDDLIVTNLDHADVVVTAQSGKKASFVILFGEDTKVTAATVDDVVATLLKDSSLGLSDIASAVWTSNNEVGDPLIIPAMLEAGVSAAEIFEDYGKTAAKVAPILKDAGVKVDEIINAYFDTTAEDGVMTVDTDLKISRNGNTYTVTVPAGTTKTITGTGVGEIAVAMGITKAEAYTTTNGTTTYTKTGDDLALGAIKTDINTYLVKGAAAGTNWTATIKVSGAEYTVNFVPAAK